MSQSSPLPTQTDFPGLAGSGEETCSNGQLIPRLRALASEGRFVDRLKVLKGNSGYELHWLRVSRCGKSCTVPSRPVPNSAA